MIDVALVRAANPGPLTLSGTNTWVAGRNPCFVVDPGPALPEHLDAVAAEAAARGGASTLVLTHSHADHSEAAAVLAERLGVPVGADGPFEVVPLPGHAPDHVVLVWGRACFTGDAVLGEGSVFVSDDLAAYLDGLRALRARDLEVLLPGHGPRIDDPAAKLDEYLAHRAERERRLLEALAAGARSVDAMLDAAWSDAPAILRPAAAVTLRAHLDKLEAEGRLPDGVERPVRPDWLDSQPH